MIFETLSPQIESDRFAELDSKTACIEAAKAHQSLLRERFAAGETARDLIRWRSDFIDELLGFIWQDFLSTAKTPKPSLIAVGGYGRREMHPHSDVDLLILKDPASGECPEIDAQIAGFLQFIWDIGLRPAQSVRGLDECIEEAIKDQTVMTNLLESRLLQGDGTLFARLEQEISPSRIWPSDEFFAAKRAEQAARYAKFHDTAFNLEPNIKEGPGGLRDIQNIHWIIKRHYDLRELDLVQLGWLTEAEHEEFQKARDFLWEIRFALHVITDRPEERLLFEYQKELARLFGVESENVNHAVEQFMQLYFRTVMGLERLNELLMQLFEEVILHSEHPFKVEAVTPEFRSVDGYLEVVDPEIFQQRPLAIFEILLLLQTRPGLKGIRASTIRLIRQNLERIDDRFREDPKACSLFMDILRQPVGVTHQLRRMNRYGVLAAYLPAFARVVGRMQYDLFHVYTVDEHTLFVVRNLRRFALEHHRETHPFPNEIFKRIEKPELLYVAGLMHDIAKGSGGDHSTLGADIAADFCRRHGIGEADTQRVCWVVQNHLLMSLTAQRKDISDPKIIHAFATTIRDETTLDYLYLLTVADIRATNPSLWNSWRDALLHELYEQARWMFRRGLANPVQQEEKLAAVQKESLEKLSRLGIPEARSRAIWNEVFSEEYFLRYHPEEIVWHTVALDAFRGKEPPLVLLRTVSQRGSAEVFIYARQNDLIFPRTTAILDQLNLTVLDARIITSTQDYVVHSYHVLEQSGERLTDPMRQVQISVRLREALSGQDQADLQVQRREARQIRHFTVPTQVTFRDEPQRQGTVMELIATDRPGLLSKVGRAFSQCDVRLNNARISTIGSRAEDIFLLTGKDNLPLSNDQVRLKLKETIVELVGES
ncbi:MAG: [Protein-PII] uridylyltransferase [Pseudomonadota bacterium]